MVPNECLPVPVSPVVALDSLSVAARVLAAFLSGRQAGTIRSYRADLEDFRAFLQTSTLEGAVSLLLVRGQNLIRIMPDLTMWLL